MLTLLTTTPAARLHADRAAGGDRHHRDPDRPAAARGPEGPRGRRRHRAARTTSSSSAWPRTTTTTPRASSPPGGVVPVDVGGRPTGGTNLWVELLPYFEQDNLYKKWDLNDNRNNVAGGRNATQAQVIKLLLCPSDPLPEPVVELTAGTARRPLGPGVSMG